MPSDDAAASLNDLSRDPARLIRCEECDDLCDVVGLPEPSQRRNALHETDAVGWILTAKGLCIGRSWRDDLHGDVARAELRAEHERIDLGGALRTAIARGSGIRHHD